MLKRRVAAVEKRLAGLYGQAEKPRLTFYFGDRTEPPREKEEAKIEKDGPIVFKMPRPSQSEGERVLRFDFGGGEGQTGRVKKETSDGADNSQPTEREMTRK